MIPGGPFLSLNLIDLDPLAIGTFKAPQTNRIHLRRQKLLSKTNVSGREGTIKEFSSFTDWEIDIDFIYVGIHKAAAILKLKELNRVASLPTEVPVLNLKLNSLGIHFLVIEDADIPEPDGSHELVARLKCSSDNPIDLSDPSGSGLLSEKGGVLDSMREKARWLK